MARGRGGTEVRDMIVIEEGGMRKEEGDVTGGGIRNRIFNY